MIRREFLKQAAALASGLAAKISYGAVPCAMTIDDAEDTDCTQSNLDQRTRALTSGNTPQLNVNYFRSEEGSPQIPNNTTSGQSNVITWQVEGIFYDPIRRRMHQLDRQHSTTHLEHAYLDETTNTWVLVDTSLMQGAPPGHWRAADFDPGTGVIYWQREGTNLLYIYDPNTDTWSTKTSTINIASSDAGNLGFHPNLFGPGKPGVLTGVYNPQTKFVAYNIADDTWHDLSQSGTPPGGIGDVLFRGWSTYIPDRDELLMTKAAGDMVAFAAGAGLETNISTANRAQNRNSITAVGGKAIHPLSTNAKSYACMHPRQPSVVLAIDAANANVYYTTDGASTAWRTAAFTHPFASELNSIGYCTVGSLPYHGVVAACQGLSNNVTEFVYWRPPLV